MDRDKSIEQHQLYDRILKYTSVFGGIQGLSILITFIMTKVKSVLIGAAGYGITENLNRSIDIVKNSTNLGIPFVSVPEISRTSSEETVLVTRSWALLTAFIGLILCAALSGVLSRSSFGDNSYVRHLAALSLAVSASAVTGGEMAVLRGMGQLRSIAMSQFLSSLMTLAMTVPLLWWLRRDGIAPALVLTAFVTCAVTCFFSFRVFRYSARPFSVQILRKGLGMIGFGVFFTIAAFLGSWAWLAVAGYLTRQGGTELTGTYSVGYMLVTYLTSMLLSVTDSEYFPRLSSETDNMERVHVLVNSQVRAMSMLSAPLVIAFIIAMPLVVFVVLEYEKFYAAISLSQLAVTGLFFKSVSQPIAYVTLAKSDTKIYLLQETLCYLLLVICVITGYSLFGTPGVGLALAVWELAYLFVVLIIARYRYSFVMPADVVRQILIQALLVGGVVTLTRFAGLWTGTVCPTVLFALSLWYSVSFFRHNTTMVPGLFSKITARFRRG